MTTKPKAKPKPPKVRAMRIHGYYDMMRGVCAVEPDRHQKANAWLVPDGAPLPLTPYMRRIGLYSGEPGRRTWRRINYWRPRNRARWLKLYELGCELQKAESALLDALSPPVRGGRGRR